ncbi:MAG: Phosphoribosyl-AMP cyclohydrolase [uncultured Thermomicrobiales bacterium]|uniref:Histidine biosynthesis bifunctional protein HisIE n=1 Tax=uncultured Thermomicrobiales bacterium TaxID=1645740 RepID=A0A6J4V9Z8_9BACT|nr:MAG: Phosphoribosyl-AMP cyclohydrolase [uncultured Thermomicrobiales bacterium]
MTALPVPSAPAFVTFGADGLVPAVLQDVVSRRVLMVGFMNADALDATRRTGLVHFWSRSRAQLWQKGESSGNVSRLVELRVNCEQNSLLLLVEQVSAICHDGYPTCYYRRVDGAGDLEIVEPRVFDPSDVYGASSVAAPRPPLGHIVARWLDAYAWLRDHDLGDQSSTSRRLRSGEDFRPRVADELLELAGVLDGSHRHQGEAEDVALEAGQVLYWMLLVAVGGAVQPEDLNVTEVIQAPGTSSAAGLPGERLTLLSLAAAWPMVAPADVAVQVRVTVAALARVCALTSVRIDDLIAGDLASLSDRPYLERWAAAGSGAAGS